jgi:hypothetical protein
MHERAIDYAPGLITTQVNYLNADERVVGVKQEIPDWHLDALKAEHAYNSEHRAGEMHRVCSIPVVIVEEWARKGFHLDQETWPRIKARLKDEGLDYFITSPK